MSHNANRLTRPVPGLVTIPLTCIVSFFKNRGLDDKEKLPYFPYRDDGQLIHDTISNMVNEFVDQ